jgi:hypothetical protein
MNDRPRVEFIDPSVNPRPSPALTGKKAAIGLLVALLASAMIAWLAFLGWGMVETLQWLLVLVNSYWTSHF